MNALTLYTPTTCNRGIDLSRDIGTPVREHSTAQTTQSSHGLDDMVEI